MNRWGVVIVAVLLAACNSDATEEAAQHTQRPTVISEPREDAGDSSSTSHSDDGEPTSNAEEETVVTIKTDSEGAESDPAGSVEALSPSEVEQAFVAYARCLAAEADHLKLRFRAEPLYGILKEIGANDPSGQREEELDRRCTESTGIGVIIENYQAANPPRPDQIADIVEEYHSCVSLVPGAEARLATISTMDDISLAQGDLLAMVTDQSQGQLVIECTESALYGPVLDTALLG